MIYDVYDDYLDIFWDDVKYFDDLELEYPSFDIANRDELTLLLKFGDVTILAELSNDDAKYGLKCFIGKNQTAYRFNKIDKLKDKTIKMNRFILKHSCCMVSL